MKKKVMGLYIVYHDVGGTHSTAVAAAIHLNQLSIDTVPTKSEILSIPLFDRLEKKDIGRLIYHGQDEYNHHVYTVSRQYYPGLIVHAMESVFTMNNRDPKELLCVDTSLAVNDMMRLGGGLSRRLGFVSVGRPIVTLGTIKAYPKIAAIVKSVKYKIIP